MLYPIPRRAARVALAPLPASVALVSLTPGGSPQSWVACFTYPGGAASAVVSGRTLVQARHAAHVLAAGLASSQP